MLGTNRQRTVFWSYRVAQVWQQDPILSLSPGRQRRTPSIRSFEVAGPRQPLSIGNSLPRPFGGAGGESDLVRQFRNSRGFVMAYGLRSMRSILRLEALDGRALPSVTVAEAGGVLTITGDQQANNIEIRDTGGSGTDAVTVWVDGVQSDVTIDTAVDKIVLYARGGQDVVAYNLT